jgi:tetratricopeptide (TPR) repeat protein
VFFERLAVFTGGWTLEAAEAVCSGRGLDSEDVLDVLAQLTRKSLVVADEVANGAERYWLQETVRDYARQKLAMRGSAQLGALRERHAEFYASLVEQQPPDSYIPTRAESAEPYALQLALLEDLAVDLNNVRAALGWYFDRGAVEEGLPLAAALGQLWSHLGRPSEGYDWLRRFLDLPPGASTARTRSRAQCWAGALALIVGEASAGYALLVDSLAYGRTAQDDVVLGEAANRWGLLTLSRGEYARARQLFEESLAAQRRLGNAEQAIRSTRFLAVAAGRSKQLRRSALAMEWTQATFWTRSASWFGIRSWCAPTSGTAMRAMACWRRPGSTRSRNTVPRGRAAQAPRTARGLLRRVDTATRSCGTDNASDVLRRRRGAHHLRFRNPRAAPRGTGSESG